MPFWAECKQRGGVYFLTRIKENASYEINDDLPFDWKNTLNLGVTSYQRIIFDSKDVLRKIECIDPKSSVTYTFITNEMTLSAGILVQIYRMRWDIEKVFDQIKNALLEQKAWTKTTNAKSIQAQMICMAHNLSLLMEHTLERDLSVVNEAEEKRRADRLKQMKKKAKAAGRQWSNVYDRVRRFTKRSL
ncbi:transposase [Verrucomicrobia bacterium]|nr:transposase [Verrucomicrobiota bacterium]